MKNWKSHLTLWSVVWLVLTQPAIGQVDEGLRPRKLQRLSADSTYSGALDINDEGQVVGYSTNAYGASRAVQWNKRGKIKQQLPCPEGANECVAVAINNEGATLGTSYSGLRDFVVVWGADGETRSLSTPARKDGSEANDLSDAGWVVGGTWTIDTVESYYYYGTYDIRGPRAPVLWKNPQHPRKLDPLASELSVIESRAVALNEDPTSERQVVGHTLYEGDTAVATAWDPQGRPTGLKPLAGHFASFALGVNRDGVVVGVSSHSASFPGTDFAAVVWGNNQARPVALKLLEGCISSRGEAINDAGFVVGSCSNCGYREAPVPVIWDPNGEVVPLPLRGNFVEGEALAINSRGDVVGWAGRLDGTEVGIVWR